MPTLVFEIEDGSQVMAPLDGRTTIGSAEGNDVVAEREDIAAHHAEIFTGLDNAWWVRDHKSPAGTFVNGNRVTSQRLSPGDLLLFGSISARFFMDENAVAMEAPAESLSPVTADPDIEKQKLEIARLDEALTNARAEFEKTINEQESRVTELQKHASGLESDIGRKKQEIAGLTGALQEAGKIADANRRKNEELTKSVAEAAGRHEMLSHQVWTLSEQQRIKLVEMERLEQDLASLESRRIATAGVLEEHEAERQRAEESLKQAALQHEQADAELKNLREEKSRLTDDIRRIGEQRGSLSQELSELEARKSEMRATLDGLDKSHNEVLTKLNAKTESLAKTTARHDQLSAGIEEKEARLAALQSEASALAAKIEAERSEADSLTSTRENLIALNQQLQAEVAVVKSRLAELSRTEEQLLESRRELHQAEAAHLSLKIENDELTRKHAATEQAALELETHIVELKETQDQLEQAIPALKSSHAEAEKTHLALTEEIERLRASAAGEQTRLGDILQKIDQAARRQAELERQSHELAIVTKQLGEVQSQLQSAELEKNQTEVRIQTLAQACSSSQLRLTEFESAEKSAGMRASHLTQQETELKNAIKQLNDEQRRERERFKEMRILSQDAESETGRQKEELTAQLAELHAEIAKLETRLMHARSWNAELDHLYEKLGKMPDASPEARETWLEIQRRKNDMADQLPSGIQVRPQSRPTVVPRSR